MRAMLLVGLGIGAVVGASVALLVSDKAAVRANVEPEPVNPPIAGMAELRAEVLRLNERMDALLQTIQSSRTPIGAGGELDQTSLDAAIRELNALMASSRVEAALSPNAKSPQDMTGRAPEELELSILQALDRPDWPDDGEALGAAIGATTKALAARHNSWTIGHLLAEYGPPNATREGGTGVWVEYDIHPRWKADRLERAYVRFRIIEGFVVDVLLEYW